MRSSLPILGGALTVLAVSVAQVEAQVGSGIHGPPSSVITMEESTAVSKRDLFFDPHDGWLDFSAFLATARGFLPIGNVITEPAVGYGGVLGFMFLHDSLVDRARAVREQRPGETLVRLTPPSVSGVGGFLTENGTWGGGVFHFGIYKQDRLRYTGALFYNSMNLDYYGRGGDLLLPIESISYTLDGAFFVQQLMVRVADTDLFLGANYKYMSFDTKLDLGLGIEPPEWFPELERTIESGGVGLVAQFDARNSIFTPDVGIDAKAETMFFREALGGDRDYFKAYTNLRGWFPVRHSLIVGLRTDVNFSDDNTPFYSLPFIDLRGISLSRFQGQYTVASEAEIRWDVTRRWSLLGFFGAGWVAEDRFEDFELGNGKIAGGTGLRYLISRVFGIRTGLDFAWSEDDFAFYITTGTAWGQK